MTCVELFVNSFSPLRRIFGKTPARAVKWDSQHGAVPRHRTSPGSETWRVAKERSNIESNGLGVSGTSVVFGFWKTQLTPGQVSVGTVVKGLPGKVQKAFADETLPTIGRLPPNPVKELPE